MLIFAIHKYFNYYHLDLTIQNYIYMIRKILKLTVKYNKFVTILKMFFTLKVSDNKIFDQIFKKVVMMQLSES